MMIMLVVSVRVELVVQTRKELSRMNNDIYKSTLKIKGHCDEHTCAGCSLGVESIWNEGLVACILDCCPAEWAWLRLLF